MGKRRTGSSVNFLNAIPCRFRKVHSFRSFTNPMSGTSIARFEKLLVVLRSKRFTARLASFGREFRLAINCAIVATAPIYIRFAALFETVRSRGARMRAHTSRDSSFLSAEPEAK